MSEEHNFNMIMLPEIKEYEIREHILEEYARLADSAESYEDVYNIMMMFYDEMQDILKIHLAFSDAQQKIDEMKKMKDDFDEKFGK